MLHPVPALSASVARRLAELDRLRRELTSRAGAGGPWVRSLRRQARASSYTSSTSIEGFPTPDDAAEIVDGAPPSDEGTALAGYTLAMDHVAVMADDPVFRWLDRVVLDLHFEATSFQRRPGPGRWRSGPVWVTRPVGPPYAGAEASRIPALMDDLLGRLEAADEHVVVRAAMAHLWMVSVHPFADGNGRVARIVQSLVLAREGPLPPELGSIEEYLGRNTDAYYRVLQAAQGRAFGDKDDARPWVAFCVDAHTTMARERLARIEVAARRWAALEALVAERRWPERLVVALERSLVGGCDRAAYAAEAEVSAATASGDLRRLVDAGYVRPVGRARSVRYVASDLLQRAAGPDGAG